MNSCSFCSDLISNFFLEDNTFRNNYDDSAFYAQHNLPRSNLLYAKGGLNFKITGNTISYSPSDYSLVSNTMLSNYYQGLPKNYFTSL